MKEKSKSEVSIIGGADGPTSIFIAGRTRKKPLKVRIRNIIYRYRRKIVEKKVVADSHTLDELVQYAMNTYNLIETNSTERKYIEQQKNLKESLILQHKPEVLGEMKDIPKPDISNEESVREYFCKIKTRSEMIAEMPDNVILLGKVTNQELLAKYYSMANLTILTSQFETFSMVCAESLCSGTPVVGFKAGAPEQISIQQYSEFVEYGKIDELESAVKNWLNKSLNKKEIANMAKEKYSNQKMLDN